MERIDISPVNEFARKGVVLPIVTVNPSLDNREQLKILRSRGFMYVFFGLFQDKSENIHVYFSDATRHQSLQSALSILAGNNIEDWAYGQLHEQFERGFGLAIINFEGVFTEELKKTFSLSMLRAINPKLLGESVRIGENRNEFRYTYEKTTRQIMNIIPK